MAVNSLCGYKHTTIAKENTTRAHKLGTPTYSYGCNEIHEVGRHMADFLNMDITTDNIQIHHYLLSLPPKGF